MRKFLNMHDEYDKLTTLFAKSYCSSSCRYNKDKYEWKFMFIFRENNRWIRTSIELYVNDNGGGCGVVTCHIYSFHSKM